MLRLRIAETILASFLFLFPSFAQSISDVTLLKQHDMKKWSVSPANYSGIAYLGGTDYVLVSDKNESLYRFSIVLDSITGDIVDIRPKEISLSSYYDSMPKDRDMEGIAFFDFSGNVFISGENDQRICEYTLDGMFTGRELKVPQELGISAIYPNYGFEALTYSSSGKLFWTTSENTIRQDGNASSFSNPQPCNLRLQSFLPDLTPSFQYAYRTEKPIVTKQPKNYAMGVVALASLEDGSLLVLEREFFVSDNYVGSWVQNKLFHCFPKKATPIDFSTNLSSLGDEGFVEKNLIAEFKTSLNLLSRSLANYEGMCLGPKLVDGRRTLLLVSDSQGNYGNSLYRMKDFIRVITFRY